MTTPAYVLGADLSHYQLRPDMDKLWDDGVRYIIPKATERMATDPDFDWIVNAAIKKGMAIPACYAFIRPDDSVATVNNFLKVANGIPLAIDDEAAGVSQSVVDMWVKRFEDGAGREGMGYYGLYPNAPISDLFASWARWFPQYPGSDSAPCRLPAWDGSGPISDWRQRFLIWQYTGTSRLPGFTSVDFDINRLAPACTLDMLAAWAKSGQAAWEGATIVTPPVTPPASTPAPAPALTLGNRDLYLHSTGNDVTELQTMLVKVGADIDVDGDFGPDTKNAVMWFQSNNPPLVVDGWAGKATDAVLIKAAA